MKHPPYLSVALAFLAATELSGQAASAGDRVRWDVGVAFLGSAPRAFENPPCGSLWSVSPEAGVAIEVVGPVLIESSIGLSLQRPVSCAFADFVPAPLNGTSTYRRFSDGVDRNPSLTSTHRLVLDPLAREAWGARVSVGFGRFWSKGVGTWSIGLGLRAVLGSSPVLLEAERIALGLPYVDETSTWSDGDRVSFDRSDEQELRETMWAVRVRLPVFR